MKTVAILAAASIGVTAQDKTKTPETVNMGAVTACGAKGEFCIQTMNIPPQPTAIATLKNGVYTWEFRDPTNTYRCVMVGTSADQDAFTVACFKQSILKPNEVGNGK